MAKAMWQLSYQFMGNFKKLNPLTQDNYAVEHGNPPCPMSLQYQDMSPSQT